MFPNNYLLQLLAARASNGSIDNEELRQLAEQQRLNLAASSNIDMGPPALPAAGGVPLASMPTHSTLPSYLYGDPLVAHLQQQALLQQMAIRNALALQQPPALSLANASAGVPLVSRSSAAVPPAAVDSEPSTETSKTSSLPYAIAGTNSTDRRDFNVPTTCDTPDEAKDIIETIANTRRTRSDPFIDVSKLPYPRPPPSLRGGKSSFLPDKIYLMLSEAEEKGLQDITSFLPHGRAFQIHKPKDFVDVIMPKYFPEMKKWDSFTRQVRDSRLSMSFEETRRFYSSSHALRLSSCLLTLSATSMAS